MGDDIKQNAFYYHTYYNYYAWGFLVDVGIMIARYYKHFKYYNYIHGFFMLALTGFSAFGICLLIDVHSYLTPEFLIHDGETTGTDKAHVLMGIVFFSFMLLQTILGVLINLFKEDPRKAALIIITKKIHLYLGYFLYLTGQITVLLGMIIQAVIHDYTPKQRYDKGLIVMITSSVALAIFEALRFFDSPLYRVLVCKQQQANRYASVSEDHNGRESQLSLMGQANNVKLITLINNNEPDEVIFQEVPNMNFVLWNDGIFDISQVNHPGPQFIFNEIKGREIGRFIFGAYGLESTELKEHIHSKDAITLLEDCWVGEVQRIGIFSFPDFIQNDEQSILNSQTELWRLHSKNKLNDTTSEFIFECLDHQVRVNNFIPGIGWFARHFTIVDRQKKLKTRLYTVVSSMTSVWIDVRLKLKQIENGMNGNTEEPSDQGEQFQEYPKTTSYLSLIIQQYQTPSGDGFSMNIHNAKFGTEYFIKGPFGRGLEFGKKLAEGTHIIVAGGTGILPFMDFLNYLLIYSYKQVFDKHNVKFDWKKIHLPSSNFEQVFGLGFQVILFCAMNTPNELQSAMDVIFQLWSLNKRYHLNLFNCIFKIPKTERIFEEIKVVSQHFDQNFFKEYLNTSVQEVQKVWVCGPPVMNKCVPDVLSKLGVDPIKIRLI